VDHDFSIKFFDLANLRKGTKSQSHRSGFPSIALKDKIIYRCLKSEYKVSNYNHNELITMDVKSKIPQSVLHLFCI
jgi:hypothetical protein